MPGDDSDVDTPDRRGPKILSQILPHRIGQDHIVLAITLAVIALFAGRGDAALAAVLGWLMGLGLTSERMLVTALLLNVALMIFGWCRYRELHEEMHERSKAEQEARRLAETDPLTGCLNRRSIGGATDRLLAQAQARGNLTAFIMVDIDNFKQLNDFHGHAMGDHVLQECACRIREILPPGALLARLGGDEFACVLAFDPAHPEEIDRFATQIITQIAAPIALKSVNEASLHEISGVNGNFGRLVSVSLGLARSDMNTQDMPPHTLSETAPETAPDMTPEPADAAALLHMADLAMYQAKKIGRNRYVWFETTMLKEMRYRDRLETAIRKGIIMGEFVPYYEQQIDLASGELCGFEMLARWTSPEFAMIGPEIFIPVAEEMGAIGELSERLIAQALRDAKNWAPHLTLSVNISPIQLRDPWFAQKLLKLLVAEGLPPSRLDIEITETCLHQNIGGVQTLIASLKNQGVGISLDDFGTGYSSLAQLRALPFDHIKIDRSFVTSMPDCSDSSTIVRAIRSLGEGLGMPVTAEGIENEEVLQQLQDLGPFKGQGYLYGHPKPPENVRNMLAQRGLLAHGQEPQPAEKEAAEAAETEERTEVRAKAALP